MYNSLCLSLGRLIIIRPMFRTQISTNCDINVNFNQGCVVEDSKPNSYGPDFNAADGGWYVMERTNSYVRVFFWSRHNRSVPLEVKYGFPTLNPNKWVRVMLQNLSHITYSIYQGKPDALFPNTECDFDSHFGRNNIIINLTLCKSSEYYFRKLWLTLNRW